MHYVDSIITLDNMQNLSYNYDKFGNLASRKDNLRNLEETFHYDKMHRLTDIYLGRPEMRAQSGEGMKIEESQIRWNNKHRW